MCGIAGIVATPSSLPDERAAVVTRMTESLAHRGPDADGTWSDDEASLGHRRLSIIDLSPGGVQPMLDESGRYVLVFNGEIYNYLELRRELAGKGYRFRTETDTEVVLLAYREWGKSALHRFNGMWAFAIWDRERRELFAARDRAGKKPFYFATGPSGSFYFASEVKALRAAGLRFGIHPQAAFDFLTQGTYGHLGEAGFFTGVGQLPAAHWLHLKPGSEPAIARYWDVPVVAEGDRLPYDHAFRRRFRDLLVDAVNIRLRADVPVGATLSGGLDSSTIVAIVDQVTGGRPLHLFTSQYPGTHHDESHFMEAVVERLSRPLLHRIIPPEGERREQLLRVLDHQEEPFGDTSIFAHFHLMRAAREQGVPVVLSGQGGDELLLGYPSMVNAYLGHLLASGHLPSALRELREWSGSTGASFGQTFRAAAAHVLPLALRDRVRQRYVSAMASIVTPVLRERVSLGRFVEEKGRSSLDSYLVQVFKRFSIPHLTHYDDRNAMAFAVEGRMPFLDHRLVDLLFSVRYEALFHRGWTKRVLRETFGDLLPPIVRERRDKVGFYTPLARWLREELPWITGFMSADRMAWLGVLDGPRYQQRLTDLQHGQDAAALEVWRGFIYHLWADRFDVQPSWSAN